MARTSILIGAQRSVAAAPMAPGAVAGPRNPRAVGIGASTGGPRALRTLLSGLPADYAVPILVVQHIGDDFLELLANWLDQQVALPVRVAKEGPLAPGVWLGPPGAHLTLDRRQQVVLDRQTRSGTHRPSVDVLFDSMAGSLGRDAVGVVLTGMGNDGARGVAALTAAGGFVVAQDEPTSVVFGMPRFAAQRGAQLVLPISEIPTALRRLHAVRPTSR